MGNFMQLPAGKTAEQCPYLGSSIDNSSLWVLHAKFINVSIFERQYLLNFKFNPNILNIERVHASNDKSELIIFLQRQWMVSIDAFLLFLAEICDKGLWRGEQFLQRLLPCKHAPNEVYTIDLIKANKKDNRIRLLQGFSNIKRMTFEEFLFFKFLYFQTLVNLARLETS